MLGTNFSLMEKLFHNRPRVELKRKFKTEEKTNPQLVDKIISQQIPFDPSQFMDLDGEHFSIPMCKPNSNHKYQIFVNVVRRVKW